MTTEQKSQLRSLFIETWNNPEIPSKELHTYLTTEAGKLGFNLNFTDESTRTSYASLGTDYQDYRQRPRKVKTGSVVDFTQDSDPGDEQETLTSSEPIGDEDELDSEVNEEPEQEEEVLQNSTEQVKQNFNW